MKHSSGLLTPAQCALRALCPSAQSRTATTRLPVHSIPRDTPSLKLLQLSKPNRRYAHMISARSVASSNNLTMKGDKNFDPFPNLVKDEQIEALYVRVVQADNSLSEPTTVWSSLSEINRDTHYLVQVQAPDPDTRIAICKLMDKEGIKRRNEEKKEAEKDNRKKLRNNEPKQLEVNWAISANDLEHKLTQMQAFLEKGRPVEIILASKRRQRKASVEEAKSVVDKIRDRLANVDGKETKTMEGELLKQAVLTVRKRGFD